MKILDGLKQKSNQGNSNAPEIALVYVGLNDFDQAIAFLESAYKERFNPTILFRPAFDNLRPDPRFQDLEQRIGLQPVKSNGARKAGDLNRPLALAVPLLLNRPPL